MSTPTTLEPTTRVPFFGSGQGTNYWYQKSGVDDEAFHSVYGISAFWTAMNTTVPVGTGANDGNYLEGVGGTSMSAPMIAALAGLLFARQSDRTTAEVMNIIKLANSGADGETSQLYNDILVLKTKTRKAGKIPGVVDYTRALPQ